jgi:hypothetical protein
LTSVKIFLSHAHADREEARWLVAELRRELSVQGHNDVEIFSTSEPENRFPEEIVSLGDDWEKVGVQHARDLREYLLRAIADATVYLLLLTQNNMHQSGPWIRLEISEATKLAREQGFAFIPCLRGVGYEALREIQRAQPGKKWEEIQVGAPPADELNIDEWQAGLIEGPAEIRKLAEAIIHHSRRPTEPHEIG